MKLLPRLPELPAGLSREERNEMSRQVSRENPSLLVWLVVSAAAGYGIALAATNGATELFRHFGGVGLVLFMTMAMAVSMAAAFMLTMRFIYLPRLEKALVRVRSNDGRR